MSGRFVSAGTAEEPPERDEDWIKAQQELETNARRKKEEGSGIQEGGKSLYEVLQSNKAAKQEAFEEAARLKNQFRSLDEDEVDFLDSVLESTRAKDEAVRKETTEQLNAFRKQQEEAEKANRSEQQDDVAVEEEEQWQVSNKKRKKRRDSENKKALKVRRASSAAGYTSAATPIASSGEQHAGSAGLINKNPQSDKAGQDLPPTQPSPSVSSKISSQTPNAGSKEPQPQSSTKALPAVPALGLVDYSSDDE